MLKPLGNSIFVISLIGYCVLKFTRNTGLESGFLHAYVADFLAMPVFMPIILTLIRLFKRNPLVVMTTTQIVATMILFAFWFEVIFPSLSDAFSPDPWDIVAYVLGAAVFAHIQNKPG
jgi:hypothetical protein